MATAVLLLVHVPPAVPFVVKLIGEPTHTAVGPLIVPASAPGLTLMLKVELPVPQLLETWYVITTLPGATPVTLPVEEFTVATAVLPLDHVPPLLPLVLNTVDEPAQILFVPEITPELPPGFTVKVK